MGAHSFILALLALVAVREAGAHADANPKTKFPVGRVATQAPSSVVLTPNVTALTQERQRIEVRVTGVRDPMHNDMVALYAPPSADPNRVVPIAWRTVLAESPAYMQTGAGRAVFTVTNHRADFVFRLLRNGTNLPGEVDVVAEGQSPVIKNALRDAPSQGHLALDPAGRYVVQWVSGSKSPQQVKWGLSSGALDSTQQSTSVTYGVTQMCGLPANNSGWLDPGWMHQATIPEMPPPGTRLFYKFGSNATGWSKVFNVGAQPAPRATTRFLVFNDVGMPAPILFNTPKSLCPPYCPSGFNWAESYGTNSTKLLPHLVKEDADVALLVGDVCYAQGFAADWDVFGSFFEPAFTRWPLMLGTGNHERDWPGTGDAFQDLSLDSGGECNVPYTYRFYTPATPRLDPRKSYYSFDVGAVHFVVLDSETPSGPGTPQASWVARDLAAVNRSRTPWIVVGMHRMMVAPSVDNRPVVGDQANSARLQADFEELFARHGVALVVCGHEHAYARTCPMLKGKCTPGGITNVLTGNAGAGFTFNYPKQMPDWVAYAVQGVNGYVRVTATADSMLVEAVGTDDGRVFDSATITQRQPAPSAAATGGGSGSGSQQQPSTGFFGFLNRLIRGRGMS